MNQVNCTYREIPTETKYIAHIPYQQKKLLKSYTRVEENEIVFTSHVSLSGIRSREGCMQNSKCKKAHTHIAMHGHIVWKNWMVENKKIVAYVKSDMYEMKGEWKEVCSKKIYEESSAAAAVKSDGKNIKKEGNETISATLYAINVHVLCFFLYILKKEIGNNFSSKKRLLCVDWSASKIKDASISRTQGKRRKKYVMK